MKRKPVKVKILKDPIYDVNYYYYTDFIKFQKNLKKLKIDVSDHEDSEGLTVFQVGSYNVHIFVKPKASDDVLVHEVFHAGTRVLEAKGMNLCHETQEAYAYYIGFLFKGLKSL